MIIFKFARGREMLLTVVKCHFCSTSHNYLNCMSSPLSYEMLMPHREMEFEVSVGCV